MSLESMPDREDASHNNTEGPKNEPQSVSRRGFLRSFGKGALAAAAVGAGLASISSDAESREDQRNVADQESSGGAEPELHDKILENEKGITFLQTLDEDRIATINERYKDKQNALLAGGVIGGLTGATIGGVTSKIADPKEELVSEEATIGAGTFIGGTIGSVALFAELEKQDNEISKIAREFDENGLKLWLWGNAGALSRKKVDEKIQELKSETDSLKKRLGSIKK